MKLIEGPGLELKSALSKTFLKTVSAFANYGTGKIVFGIEDDGTLKGVDDPAALCHDIENAINDSVRPTPRYTLEPIEHAGADLVVLQVFEGPDKPYLFKGKAFRRSSISTVEVDRLALSRLVLEGQNLSFEEVPCKSQDLEFSQLAAGLKKKASVDATNLDVLKTLQLYSDSTGYNNAAGVIADSNPFPGVDMVRFGATEDEMFERRIVEGVSALAQLDAAMAMFSLYYQPETVRGAKREVVDLIPRDAFREAVANALVHRMWDSPSAVRIGMFPDRVEVHSPGGLPLGITEEEYMDGRVSLLRNPIIGNVFFRLGHIEKFGTGVRRIKRLYAGFPSQPKFTVSGNAISVKLPTFNATATFPEDERAVLEALGPNRLLGRANLDEATGFSKDKTSRLLRSLIAKGAVEVEGRGRGARYRRA